MSFTQAVVSFPNAPQLGRAPHGSAVLVHATGDQTDGEFGIWETFVTPGKGPLPHTHTRETEVFRVIAGTFRFTCGEETFHAPVSTVATLPPHVPHSWVNIGETMGRVMAIVSPAGFEQLFLEIAAIENPTSRDVAMIEKRLGGDNQENRRL